jgi:hypothetical protein
MMNIIYWFRDHKKASLSLLGVVLFIFLMIGANNHQKQKKLEQQKKVEQEQKTEPSTEGSNYVEGTDAYLMSMQTELRKSFGTPPKGFIWDLNGNTISLGDKSMSSEDVLYAYIRALSTLDMATAQKYSRDAKVVETYNDYFSKENANQSDYQEQFMRSMYKQALTSMEITGIESSSKFANNKVVYTVKLTMLDLTDKDFWEKDKDILYKNMLGYESKENDSTKLEILLYDYILKYYKSEDAVKRNVTFDVTLQRYPDIDSGWLVSIDKDIDDAARYSNGTLVTNYITEQFRQWMIDQRSNGSISPNTGGAPTKED